MREYIVPVANTDRDDDEMFIGFMRKRPELIRCRYCANYDDNKNYCNVWKAKNQPNDGFCHFGERKPND